MTDPGTRHRIAERIGGLVRRCELAQIRSIRDLPRGQHRVAVGQYVSTLAFLVAERELLASAHPVPPGAPDVLQLAGVEANGSTLMGLWFLSEAHGLLGELAENDPDDDLRTSAEAILRQIRCAREVPRFFQGTTEDVHRCPPGTMGWYPLVDGARLPAVMDRTISRVLRWADGRSRDEVVANMANLSDGDAWAWCVTVDDTTPGILAYHGDPAELRRPEVVAPLLGSSLRTEQPPDPAAWLNPESLRLWRAVAARSAHGGGFPIQTFYEPTRGPRGGFSCVVMGNILSALPLVDEIPAAWADDLETSTAFVRAATRMALRGELAWSDLAYDYWTIPTAPVAFLVRAQRRIAELRRRPGRASYPDLLDDELLDLLAADVAERTREHLDRCRPEAARHPGDPEAVNGNVDYAALVFGFNAMMNLRRLDPDRHDRTFGPDAPDPGLADRVAERLLIDDDTAYRTPGTGPYPLFEIGPFSVHVSMGSVCFVAPPLIEAYAYYLGTGRDGGRS